MQRAHNNIGFRLVSVVLVVFIFGVAFCLISPRPARAISGNIVISEFRTRGPAGEADDFIELFNRADENVSIGTWQVKAQKTRSTISVTVTIPNDVVLYPGSHYLIAGSAYSGAVKPDQSFPGMADNVGIGLLTPGGAVVDAVGTDFNLYQEGGPLVTLVTDEDRGYERKPIGAGGVVDTDHNSLDFRLISPSNPQNYSISLISGIGIATPSTVSPGSPTLLTVEVNPGKFPTSTGLSVTTDLSLIGESNSQTFYDDATHGDAKAADNIFSFQTLVPDATSLGPRLFTAHVTDLQGRETRVFFGLNVENLPPPVQCNQERSSVKTGTDADVGKVNLSAPEPTTILTMRGWPKPASIPANNRILPYETTVWVINATLTLYKLEGDSYYHLILRDEFDNTIIARIPCPCCVGLSSPFASAIGKARSQFEDRFTANDTFQTANVPVRITGLGFFDAVHDQTNGIELDPVLDIKFDVNLRKPIIISASMSGKKKLLVFGLNFDSDAVILLNGDKQKTSNDEDSSTTLLIGKKAGKKIERGIPVTLQIKNSDGTLSEPFSFTRP